MTSNTGSGAEGDASLPPKKKSRLPAELRFLVDLPDTRSMDSEEFLEFLRGHYAKLCAARETLSRHGLDANALIADMGARLKECEKTSVAADAAVDKLLHATADLADTQREVFKALEPLVEAACKERPFDPQVQEWKEYLEEWRLQMPKEE